MALHISKESVETPPGPSYTPNWCRVNLNDVPHVVTPLPGPKSKALHGRAEKHVKGLSGQVRLFPVCFESGQGITLRDVDGNTYLDFSSGIYVTNLGHCHPKVSEAISRYAHTLLNAHDFITPIKLALAEKLSQVLPGDLNGMQFYDSGTTAVEAGIRLLRSATGNHEILSCYADFHGKSMGSVACARMNAMYGPARPAGFYMLPRPDMYRPHWTRSDGTLDSDAYIAHFEQFVLEATTGQVAGFVLEPIQGWAGTIVPPDDFFPKLRRFCDAKGYLILMDEVLTGMGRTGKWLCSEHWGIQPDIVTLGKGFGNGFPVTACIAREDIADHFNAISASTSYGGNPMACAAALACIEVIEQEQLLDHVMHLGEVARQRLLRMKTEHPIIGDVRVKGCLMGVELVKDRQTKEPFAEAGREVYQRAFRKGLAWIPAGHILRMSPPLVINEDELLRGLDLIDEAIGETERDLIAI